MLLHRVRLGALTAACLLVGGAAAQAGKPAPSATSAPAAAAEIAAAHALDPEDPLPLQRMAELCAAAGDADGECALVIAALDAWDTIEDGDAKTREQALKQLPKRLLALDPELAKLGALRDEYLAELSKVLITYANNKKQRNALELAAQILDYRPNHPRALDTARALQAKGDAELRAEAERLLSRRELRRPRRFRRAWERAHASWEQADELATSGYTVRTDSGYEVLQRTAFGLEQIARACREIYGEPRAQQNGKTLVQLCRTRAEYVAVAKEPALTGNEQVLAFLRTQTRETSKSFELLAFDPRDDGRPLESLDSVLFHEASHQFMELATGAHHAPGWLHEGLACYFEGALLDAEGRMRIGMPARDRLDALIYILQAKPRPLQETLEVERLAGEHYPVAWGLAYYLYEQRDEQGRYVYRELLRGAIRQVARQEMPGLALFQSCVLQPLGRTLEDFESEWTEGMRALLERESAPGAALAWELERAREHAAAGREEALRESLERAWVRDPDCAQAWWMRARLARNRKTDPKGFDRQRDEVLLCARRALALSPPDAPWLEEVRALGSWADPYGMLNLPKARARYREAIEALIASLRARGRPKTAVALARRYLDDVLGGQRGSELAAELRAAGTLALERPRTLFDGSSLEGLQLSQQRFALAQGTIRGEFPRPARGALLIDEKLAPLFRCELEAVLSERCVLAIYATEGLTPSPRPLGFALHVPAKASLEPLASGFWPFDQILPGQVARLDQSWSSEHRLRDFSWSQAALAKPPIRAGQPLRIALERRSAGELRLLIGGEPVATRPIDVPAHAPVRLGLVVYGGKLELRALGALEFDRF